LNEGESINGFWDYLKSDDSPLKCSPSEEHFENGTNLFELVERFSQTNLILTLTKTSLLMKTISVVLFMRVVGPPVSSPLEIILSHGQ
jgi:hypothetical protein